MENLSNQKTRFPGVRKISLFYQLLPRFHADSIRFVVLVESFHWLYKDEKISLTLNSDEPVYVKSRRIPYKLREIADQTIRTMCDKKIIEESRGSEYNSPILLIKKPKSDKYRFCTDFRLLNSKLKQNRFPLPRIKDLIERLKGSKYFTSLDLKHGFYNIVLDEKTDRFFCKSKTIPIS